ncbi:MAG: dependent helicase, Lhr family [Bacteroidota bacterium]|jgi:ATP-dependent Lhr-like helicase
MHLAEQWFEQRGFTPHVFQKDTWQAIADGKSGLLNAPTGFGKTYAIWFGVLQHYFSQAQQAEGLHALWLTPLRALSKEIVNATNTVSEDLQLNYRVELRTGDTASAQRQKQKLKPPHALVSTPESIHLLFTNKNYDSFFSQLKFIIVDEWHELLGTKRGVQIELAIAHLRSINPNLIVWGISATIGNLLEAKDILLHGFNNTCIIKSKLKKKIAFQTIFPENIETYSWAGHLGLQLLPQVIDIVNTSNSTLIFTNTRGQAELWYQRILDYAPELAGIIALHHGSLSQDIRAWVESNLHTGKLKAVVATSSLDLGVDFHPVDAVVQIGSPKGIARVMQRAGRSGHQPHVVSKLYYAPTNTLEIIEGAAVQHAMANNNLEQRIPYKKCFDVLVQFLVTLSISNGFRSGEVLQQIRQTHCYAAITDEEFDKCISFITVGGASLGAYAEYNKVHLVGDRYHVASHGVSRMHRISIGTIVSDAMMVIKYVGGKRLGQVEEWFTSRLKPGDVFWFAGHCLQLVRIKDMEVHVRKSNSTKGIVPSYMGGRLPLSSQLGDAIKIQIDLYNKGIYDYKELDVLAPVLELQNSISRLPLLNTLLIETLRSVDGFHIFIYPFEGRFIHEGIASVLAYRIGQRLPISISMAMNDYGLELLLSEEVDVQTLIDEGLFDDSRLVHDVLQSVNATEMARRCFRDIACISGLVFNGYPGEQKKARHLQASAQLFFEVYQQYEPENLLYQQAFQEVLDFQLDVQRMQDSFKRMQAQKIHIQQLERPSPFCFPLIVDQLREKHSTESLETKIARMVEAATTW